MKTGLSILLISFPLCGFGQVELVQNGSFEDYSELPNFLSQIERSTGWTNPMFEGCVWSLDSCSTPDFFHLQGVGYGQLPNCFLATIQPYEGTGIGGMAAFVNWGGREFVFTEFNNPMIKGNSYRMSMHVSNGIPNLNGDSGSGWGLDGFGIGLSTQEPVQYHYAIPPPVITATFTIDSVIFSEDWVEYSTIILADSNYQYLTIGNFKDGENEMIQFYPENSMFNVAYYFIDDVSVLRLDTVNLVYEWQDAVRTFSQTTEQISVSFDENVRSSTAILYDMAGRETGRVSGNGSSLSLSIGHLLKGIYVLQLRTDIGTVSRKVVMP